MRLLFFGFLGLVAFVLIAALLVGFAFKLVGLGLLAVIVVAAVSFALDRFRGRRGTLKLGRRVPPSTLTIDHAAERLPR